MELIVVWLVRIHLYFA